MAFGAERIGNPHRGLKLDPVALVVIDRQREQAKAGLPRKAGADHRIEPAGKKDDGGFVSS